MHRLVLSLYLILAILPARADERALAVSWIWKSTPPGATERVFFRREFQLPPDVASAVVTVSCDNWQRLFVNGHDMGKGTDWHSPSTYNVLAQLKPGTRNVIAVEGRNEGGVAGMALSFRATLKDGKKLHVASDGNWLCENEAPEGWQDLDFPSTSWAKAVVLAKVGDPPWGDVMKLESSEPAAVQDKSGSFSLAPVTDTEEAHVKLPAAPPTSPTPSSIPAR